MIALYRAKPGKKENLLGTFSLIHHMPLTVLIFKFHLDVKENRIGRRRRRRRRPRLEAIWIWDKKMAAERSLFTHVICRFVLHFSLPPPPSDMDWSWLGGGYVCMLRILGGRGLFPSPFLIPSFPTIFSAVSYVIHSSFVSFKVIIAKVRHPTCALPLEDNSSSPSALCLNPGQTLILSNFLLLVINF